MRRLAGACAIVTSHFDGEPAGLTATAICSMTVEPPRLLACVNRICWAYRAIRRCQVIAVNILATEHESLARRFAGLSPCTPQERFREGKWTTGALGAPVLQDALANLECRVVDYLDGSTHSMFVCEVVGVRVSPLRTTDPLLYFGGSFARLASEV
ncbi:flavin reductase family protein [Dyella tabacisoli]|nr:flavin reductase family protein [Dyella tabacisoli]